MVGVGVVETGQIRRAEGVGAVGRQLGGGPSAWPICADLEIAAARDSGTDASFLEDVRVAGERAGIRITV